MSLLQLLMQRGGLPGAQEAQRMKEGGDMPPMRGITPWPSASGFEGQQKLMLQELLRAAQMREPDPTEMQRLIPMLRAMR